MDLTNAVEHYSWVAYEAAVNAYGIDDPRSWEAFETWAVIACPVPS